MAIVANRRGSSVDVEQLSRRSEARPESARSSLRAYCKPTHLVAEAETKRPRSEEKKVRRKLVQGRGELERRSENLCEQMVSS